MKNAAGKKALKNLLFFNAFCFLTGKNRPLATFRVAMSFYADFLTLFQKLGNELAWFIYN